MAATGWWLLSVLLVMGLPAAAQAATAKRVLIVHSFGNAAPPFTTHSTAFERELTEKLGEKVDLDEVSLDVARYATLDMEEALVDLMRKRQTKWQPDLVVPIGSPAGVFVASHRDRLFPAATPVIYVGMDKRRLPAGALEHNATFVGESFDLPGVVDDILQIAPETEHIAVIIGASPLEQYWKEVMRREFQPYEGRVKFTWLDDLSLEGMLQRARSLPPRSFLLMVLMMRDASGVTVNADEVLQQIHAVANAPINGMFQHQLGMGIVGGRLYQAEQEGVEAAHIAMRILRGEAASSIPPKIVGALPPRYDWRELEKWGIKHGNLPAGSTLLHRTPAAWELYRGWIIGAMTLFVTQTLLIYALVANLLRRRRGERSLAKREERVKRAADAPRLGVWELNTRTKELWASDQARALFELGQDIPRDWTTRRSRVHPEDRAAREAAIERAIQEGSTYELEYRVPLKDGTLRWLSGRGRCMPDETGRLARLIGVSMDVTGQKEAQELFRVATESSPSGTLLVDERGVIVLANAHVEELFGHRRDELLGMPIEMLLSGRPEMEAAEDRANHLTALRDRIMEGREREILARRKDGSEFPAEVGLNPVEMPSGVMTLATVVDISQRKQAEEEARRRREQIDVLGRASLLGEMTASLAHELGQPLAAILANASAGVRFIDNGDADAATLREILAAVGEDGRRAQGIIYNVRNAIKKGSALRSRVDLNKVVENVVLMLRPDAAVHLCEMHTSLAGNLPLIEADPVQMQQVLLNLVTNAFHAMRETPAAKRRVEITTALEGANAVLVSVRDHGQGISEEGQQRLFEQFYTTRKDGLGMGLPIVRSIIEAHGGKIAARNAEGGGACFLYELPVTGGSELGPVPREREDLRKYDTREGV